MKVQVRGLWYQKIKLKQKIMITLKKDVYVNICKKVTNHKKTAYGRDSTKQEEMPYFHCGPLR